MRLRDSRPVLALRAILGDHPNIVNGFLLIAAGVSAAAIQLWLPGLNEALRTEGAALALGVLSLAGVLAGFVGVIVVFGLQAAAPVFVRFRVNSGQSLGRNWIVLIGTGFSAAGLALGAAIAYALDATSIGFGLLLAGTLLCGHCALRMLWLVRVLIDAVRIDDHDKLPALTNTSAHDRYDRS